METLYVAILVVQLASGGDASWVVDENLTADDCAYVQADWETGDKDVEVICRPQW